MRYNRLQAKLDEVDEPLSAFCLYYVNHGHAIIALIEERFLNYCVGGDYYVPGDPVHTSIRLHLSTLGTDVSSD